MIYLESRKGKFGLNLPFRTTFYNFQSSPYKKGLSARKTTRRRPLANVVRPSVEWKKRHSIKVTFGEIGQFSLLLWWVQVLLLFPVFSSKKVLKELCLCCQLQLNSFSHRLILITWKNCLACLAIEKIDSRYYELLIIKEGNVLFPQLHAWLHVPEVLFTDNLCVR